MSGMAPSFVRANVRAMQGYTPGEQPGPGERVVKLNTNENPFPPSERVMKAIREIEPELLRRYPSPTGEAFRDAAAKLWGVSRDMILCGNGSDDILTIATRAFVPPEGSLAFPDPTYSLYPVLSQLEAAHAVTVPWDREWSLPMEALLETEADAIYIANPNAPTGTFVSPLRIAELAKRFTGAVLVDEAYADFADDNCVSLVAAHPNLIITRTLSKAYSLAGLRFGYAIAQAPVIEQLMKVKDSYNVDAISIIAATAAVQDQEHARRGWEHVRSERQRVSSELTQLGWNVLPSQANFILAQVPSGKGRDAYLGLKQQGILVRFFNLPGLTDKLRITIGTSQENNALIGGVRSLSLGEKTRDEPVPLRAHARAAAV
jgi:histidinol-phosphate aminotransferase